MSDSIYKIILADGTEISGLRLNGNNFISDVEIEVSIFEDNCSSVTINDGETEEVYENMELVQLKQYGSEYWFILRNVSAKELADRQLRSDLEYLAMMCDIEL